jgi:hypothetical protein
MSNRTMSINNLPSCVRADGIIDVVENSMGITSVEAEYDRAMRAQGEYERAHPLEAAISRLEHAWKSNRFSSSGCDYGWNLQQAQKSPLWEQIKAAVESKGLPVTWAAWKVVEANYVWKLRHKLVLERRMAKKVLEGTPWYAQYLTLVEQGHPVLEGKWQG